MKRGAFLNALALSLAFVVITGCSSLYYGYTAEQWGSLSDAEKQKAKESYSDIINAKSMMAGGNPRDDATKAFVQRAIGKTGN